MKEKDIEELGEKLKDLENSIRDFQDKHTNQVNSLIDLFNNVLEIIKTKDTNEEEEKLTELDKIKILNNEFSDKTPKEMVDYIKNISTITTNNDENEHAEIKINFDELKIEIPNDFETYKVIKIFEPVKEWIDAFKKTDKYLNVKIKLNNEMELK